MNQWFKTVKRDHHAEWKWTKVFPKQVDKVKLGSFFHLFCLRFIFLFVNTTMDATFRPTNYYFDRTKKWKSTEYLWSSSAHINITFSRSVSKVSIEHDPRNTSCPPIRRRSSVGQRRLKCFAKMYRCSNKCIATPKWCNSARYTGRRACLPSLCIKSHRLWTVQLQFVKRHR